MICIRCNYDKGNRNQCPICGLFEHNPGAFWWGFGVGMGAGFLLFTTLGREIIKVPFRVGKKRIQTEISSLQKKLREIEAEEKKKYPEVKKIEYPPVEVITR